MERIAEALRKLRQLLQRRKLERELEEEIRLHLELRAASYVDQGLAAEEARYAARRRFGNAGRIAEDSRAAWSFRWLESLGRDLRLALRMLSRSPGFTAVAVLTLALGLGANMAIFTLLYNAVLRPLGYPASDRLASVYLLVDDARKGTIKMAWSYPKFEDVRRETRSFESLAAYAAREFTLTGTDHTTRIRGEFVSAAYFPMLGVAAARGRLFRADEDAADSPQPIAVISHALWRSEFGGSESVLGRPIRINGTPLTIVGVLGADFKGESGRSHIWLPFGLAGSIFHRGMFGRAAHWHQAVGRLAPGTGIERADQEVSAIMSRIEETRSSRDRLFSNWRAGAAPLKNTKVDPTVARSLSVLLAATVFVLLIACANLANLLLGRAVARGREVAVRLAIGASRAALVRQFLVESTVLAAGGFAAGLSLAYLALGRLAAMLPQVTGGFWHTYTRALDAEALRIEVPVMAFGLVLSLATALAFGLVPAVQATRAEVNTRLKSGTPRGGAGHLQLRGGLAAVQIALAIVLLAGTGLMVRSLNALLTTTFGAETRQIITMRIDLPRTYGEFATKSFFRAVEARAASLPGVEAVATSETVPVLGHYTVTLLDIEGRQGIFSAGTHSVTPGYFSLYRIPLRRGRLFDDRDRAERPRVLVINESAARRFFPSEDPVGKRIRYPASTERTAEVIGVVGDVRYGPPQEAMMPEVYMSTDQSGSGGMLSVRTSQDPEALAGPLREIVRSLERGAPVSDVRTMEQRVAAATSGTRFSAVLLAAFSGLALALAAIGVYGMFSYAVAARTRELGIRIAVGAHGAEIVRMIFRDAAVLCAVGMGCGLPLALAATRTLSSMLYQVKPGDPGTYAISAAVLIGAVTGACYFPARRAAKVDPIAALRHE